MCKILLKNEEYKEKHQAGGQRRMGLIQNDDGIILQREHPFDRCWGIVILIYSRHHMSNGESVKTDYIVKQLEQWWLSLIVPVNVKQVKHFEIDIYFQNSSRDANMQYIDEIQMFISRMLYSVYPCSYYILAHLDNTNLTHRCPLYC